jgi:predicted nuclease of restriction endonuclease-like (RecB) superfamily
MKKKLSFSPLRMGEGPGVRSKTDLYSRIRTILESARTNIARSVNSTQVIANWLVGREIVEEEQQGNLKAEYGKRVIAELSDRLQKDFGNGYSVQNLFYMRQFYSEYPNLVENKQILHALRGELDGNEKIHAVRGESIAAIRHQVDDESWKPGRLNPNLSWTHYRTLLKVKHDDARSFYEIESAKDGWSARQLERQIDSLLFERLLKSRDKKGVLALSNKGLIINKPIDIIKDPMILEFLDLPESHRLNETKLETALISKLKDFLLELGSGFAYVGRQKRLTLEGDHFYSDLVFYHIKLKCYVVIDLKTRKLTHGDLGQMLMYVNYFDREIKTADENPTIGLILCTNKNDAVAEYVLGDKQKRIFTSRYQHELPTVKELERELQREIEMLSALAENRITNKKKVIGVRGKAKKEKRTSK